MTEFTCHWKLLEHPADIRIEVYGKTLEEIFLNAADAMTSILVGPVVRPKELFEKKLVLQSERLEDLLVEWLKEILFLFYVEKFVFGSGHLTFGTANILDATLVGHDMETVDLRQEGIEIKGVTYHGLLLQKTGDGFVAQIIFDA